MKALVFFVLTLLPVTASAQTKKLWEKSYPMGTDNYEVKGMKLDEDENLYLYGHRGDTLLLQKQDSNGNVLWTLNHHNPDYKQSIIKDIAITDSFVYAIGHAITPMEDHYIVLLKYTTDGDSIWFREHFDPNVIGRGFPYTGFPYGSQDYQRYPAKILADSLGYLYGFYSGHPTNNLAAYSDILIIKYYEEGVLLWTRGANIMRNSFPTVNFFRDIIATDSTGFLVIGESRNPAGKRGFLILSMDTSGTVNWNQYESLVFSWNFAKGAATDSESIYALAEMKDTAIDRMSASCIKYTKTGVRIWRKDIHYSSTSEDTPIDIFMDDSSNVYVTAITTDSLSGNIFYCYKLDSSGNQLWRGNIKANTQVFRSVLTDMGGGGSYVRTNAATASVLNPEHDLLTLWVDSLKNPTHTDKVLSCGLHLWNKVADSSYIPVHFKLGKQDYYTLFYHGNSLVTAKFRDTNENRNIPFLSASAIGARKVELTWSSSALPVDSIKIERSLDNMSFVLIAAKPSAEETHADYGLIPNTTYYYRAYSKDAFGNYCPLAFDTATTWDNVGIHQAEQEEILFFPNPVSNELYLQLENVDNVRFRILDLQGKLLRSGTCRDRIDCAGLPAGVYLIELETPLKKYVPRKIIKL
ncbi:MAG: T9SS type A sorting domain-containing protein [Bacteroidetes bacterium]|nr:MAG: T9SS type A sorting domain-containing protein [Bacteroidota bacterium]